MSSNVWKFWFQFRVHISLFVTIIIYLTKSLFDHYAIHNLEKSVFSQMKSEKCWYLRANEINLFLRKWEKNDFVKDDL